MNVSNRIQMPHTYQDIEGLNIGDSKIFPDGSKRVLEYSQSGGRRWFALGKEDNAKDFKSQGNKGTVKQFTTLSEEVPENITIPEWEKFNQYLTEDNPFINCRTYDDLLNQWFSQTSQLQENIEIGVIDKDKVLKDMDKTDNYFFAILAYKLSVVIYRIKKIQPYFNYKKYLRGKKWNNIFKYYDSLNDIQETDYTKLYE